MAKKKKQGKPLAVCGSCAMWIDLDELNTAAKADRTYTHTCGRVLYWGENAEVSPISNHDDLSSTDSRKRSNPSSGDAS